VSNIFDLTAARFSALTALGLAQFSELAYREPDEIRTVLDEGGMRMTWIEDKASDTQLFVASDDDVTVVCFRGTQEKRDWLTDLDSSRVEYEKPEGVNTKWMVHRGFWIAYALIAEKLLEAIREHGAHKPLLITGHSLGGALAAVAALDLAARSFASRLYTFGQPRVGDAYFVRALSNAALGYHRFVNNNDIVPRLPPAGMKSFRHAGRLNYFDHQGNLHLDPLAWVQFVDRVIGRIKDFGKPGTDGIKDHSMGGYVKLVDGYVRSLGEG